MWSTVWSLAACLHNTDGQDSNTCWDKYSQAPCLVGRVTHVLKWKGNALFKLDFAGAGAERKCKGWHLDLRHIGECSYGRKYRLPIQLLKGGLAAAGAG